MRFIADWQGHHMQMGYNHGNWKINPKQILQIGKASIMTGAILTDLRRLAVLVSLVKSPIMA